MNRTAARTMLLLAGVALLLSAVALTGASNAGDQDRVKDASGWREQGLSAPPGAIVHDVDEERPPAGYPFTDPNQYWPVVVHTDSQEVGRLLTAQALYVSPYASVYQYYRVSVPEPLIPLLEQHPAVYRLAWNGDRRPDPGRTIPEDVGVAVGKPPQGYSYSDPKQYNFVYVFTKSRAVRELVAAQALPSSHLYSGMVYGGTLLTLTDLGFAAWVPDPLIPVLEVHPEVERLEWNGGKMPLYTPA